MSNNSEQVSESEEVLAARAQLEKSLRMLKVARNDNEKMASLLLFTHLMKTNESLTVDNSEVFHAIGAKFIVRLLNSGNVPEGCPAFMYKALALSILASFSEKDLLFHPLIVSNLSAIAEVLSVGDNFQEALEMVQDSAKVLVVFSRTRDGCGHLLEKNCLPVICRAFMANLSMDSNLVEVLTGVLYHLPAQAWNHCGSELGNMLDILARKFAENQDMEKFTICNHLLFLLTSLCENHAKNQKDEIYCGTKCKADIRQGVRDILQSRCKIAYKHSALQLASGMIELFGVEWTLTSSEKVLDISNTQFWLILLSVSKTEVKLILESGDQTDIQEKSAVVVSCYRILEKTIEFLISEKSGSWVLSDSLVLQVHAILVEAISSIIQFLLQCDNLAPSASDIVFPFRKPVVISTVRVLCAWLSEETSSLSEGVSKVLPVLLKWARSSFEEDCKSSHFSDSKTPHEIVSYLLPPLCHLSADETFCAILVKEEAHVLLAKLFDQLWEIEEKELRDASSLITVCNVLLNFSILEVELVKTSHAFDNILNCIMSSLPRMMHSSHVSLTAHFVLLGLMLFRHRCPLKKGNLSALETNFLASSINFLKHAQVSVSDTQPNDIITDSLLKEWDNISELWFLSAQNLVACAKAVQPVKKLLLSSGWVEEAKQWAKSCNKNNEKIFTDLKSALLPIINFV